MKKIVVFAVFVFLMNWGLYAQEDAAIDSVSNSSLIQSSSITVWGYADVYYAYSFNRPPNRIIGEMVNGNTGIYSFNRHNEFNLNNGILGVRYSKDNVRAALSLQAGTYVLSNYAAEPDALKGIFEAYAGYQIGKKTWVDAGIFASHIGFESAMSFDCATLSRSMLADNSPYYETGAKITYEPSDKISIVGLVLNGWQNIIDHNKNKALGTQLKLKPHKNVLLNWSTFYGKEVGAYDKTAGIVNTDSLSTTRFFNNFYFQANVLMNVLVIAGFDIGLQEKRIGKGSYIWYSPVLVVKYDINNKFAVAGRTEYYHDKYGVIVNSGTINGFQTFAASLNFDYKLKDNILWRIEGKIFNSKDKVYLDEDKPSNKNTLVMSSLAIKF